MNPKRWWMVFLMAGLIVALSAPPRRYELFIIYGYACSPWVLPSENL